MDNSAVFEKLVEIAHEVRGISKDSITRESTFTDDLGADSLDIFQIMSELEDAFDMEFSNEAAETIKTVGEAVDYVEETLK